MNNIQGATAQLPDRALSEWQQWGFASAKPKVIGQIDGGLTNRLYRVRVDASDFVLRIHHPQSVQLGVDRTVERIIHLQAQYLGIAPKYRFLSTDLSYSLLDYFDSQVWDQETIEKPANQQRLFQLLEPLRRAEFTLPKFNYAAHIQRYISKLPAMEQDDWRAKTTQLLREIDAFNPQWGITHHDLNPLNVLEFEGKLQVIDWEYAGYGWCDLDRARLGLEAPDCFVQLNELMDNLWFLNSKH